MARQKGPGKDRRRRLTPQEKYQVWLEVVARDGSQREVADRWGVNRVTVMKIAQVAKQAALDGLARSVPGRPGKSLHERELEAALAEIGRLTETIKEQAVELMLLKGYVGDPVKSNHHEASPSTRVMSPSKRSRRAV